MITAVLAAADIPTIVNNALTVVRSIGVGIIVLMGSGHLIGKTIGHQFTIGVLARTTVICCAAVALFLLLPTLAETVTGTAGRVAGTNVGVR